MYFLPLFLWRFFFSANACVLCLTPCMPFLSRSVLLPRPSRTPSLHFPSPACPLPCKSSPLLVPSLTSPLSSYLPFLPIPSLAYLLPCLSPPQLLPVSACPSPPHDYSACLLHCLSPPQLLVSPGPRSPCPLPSLPLPSPSPLPLPYTSPLIIVITNQLESHLSTTQLTSQSA